MTEANPAKPCPGVAAQANFPAIEPVEARIVEVGRGLEPGARIVRGVTGLCSATQVEEP